MTIKNTNLGGTDFIDNTKVLYTDMNDTYNALINFGVTCTNYMPPVGSIIPFHKDWLISRYVPDGWVSCSGQVLSDTKSLLNGQTMPNLNGTDDTNKLFLIGNTTSGNTGGVSTHTHSYSTNRVHYQSGVTTPYHSAGSIASQTSIPPCMDIHWIMRVR